MVTMGIVIVLVLILSITFCLDWIRRKLNEAKNEPPVQKEEEEVQKSAEEIMSPYFSSQNY